MADHWTDLLRQPAVQFMTNEEASLPKSTGAHPAVQALVGLVMSAMGFVLTVGLATEAGETDELTFLLPLAAVAGCALVWFGAWAERRQPVRKLATPALLFLASAGPLLADRVGEDNQIWVGLAAFGLGLGWAAISLWLLVHRPEERSET